MVVRKICLHKQLVLYMYMILTGVSVKLSVEEE